ncbi:MAG: hypothetical protein ACREX0_13320 [Noviherbaspirillum sp.]
MKAFPLAVTFVAAGAFAHHGWGEYDANQPLQLTEMRAERITINGKTTELR